MNHESPDKKPNPLFEEKEMKRFIETRGIGEEDRALIEELAAYPSSFIVEQFHNRFGMLKERSTASLEADMANSKNERRKRAFELFLALERKYGWITCGHLAGALEDRRIPYTKKDMEELF